MIQWLVFGEKRTEGTASQPQSGQAFNSNFQIFQVFVLLKRIKCKGEILPHYLLSTSPPHYPLLHDSWLRRVSKF